MSQRSRPSQEIAKDMGTGSGPTDTSLGSKISVASASALSQAEPADSNGRPQGRQPVQPKLNGPTVRRKAKHPQEDQEAQDAGADAPVLSEAATAARTSHEPTQSMLPAEQLDLFDALPELSKSVWSSEAAADAAWQLAQAGSAAASSPVAGAPAASAASAAGAAAAGGAASAAGSAGALLAALGAAAAVSAASRSDSGSSRAPSPTPDTRTPVLQSISGSAAANTVTLLFDEALDAARLPATTAFQVRQGQTTLAVSRVSVDGAAVTLHLAGDLQAGAFSLSYVDPSTGNDTHALQDASGNDVANVLRGVVSDGYLYGASIYIDDNGDGLPQPAEDTGIKTAIDGSFVWTGPTPDATLLAAGGINTDTGLPNTLLMSSSVGSGVINPLTSLVHRLVVGGNSTARASEQLALALGLTPGTDLSQYDPLADLSANGLAAQKVAAQIATLLSLAQADAAAQAAVLERLADEVGTVANARAADPNASTLQMANTALLGSLLAEAGSNLSAASLSPTLAALASTADFDALAKAQSAALGLSVASNTNGAPSAVIGASKLVLKPGEQALVSLAFSEPVQGLGLDDLTVVGASLADLAALPAGRFYAATLTPRAGTNGPIAIALAADSYTNAAGLPGNAASGPVGLRVDGRQPMVSITPATQPVLAGQTTLVSFEFDEPVTFDVSQVSVLKGSLSGWSGSGATYSATFTPTNALQSTLALIEVPGSAYMDLAGNPGVDAGVGLSLDTPPPPLPISSNKPPLQAGAPATLSLNFNEPVQGLSLNNLQTGGLGTVSNLQANGPRSYTATFTPAVNTQSSSVQIEVDANAYTDLAGNHGMGDSGVSVLIDTRPPSLSITSSRQTLIAGQSALITFTFDEVVSGFDLSDVATTNGSLSAWAPATGTDAGKVYTATFTPAADLASGQASFSVAAGSYTDILGNGGAAATGPNLPIDTLVPRLLAQGLSSNAAAGTITMTFDSALDTTQVPTSAFRVTRGDVTLNASSVSIAGSTATLQVAGLVANQPISLTYTPGSGGVLQDPSGNDAPGFMQGIVADGYIRGARIYIDANGDGIGQDDEYTGVKTRADGSFVLPELTGLGPILAVGGVNTDTGVPNTLTLSAPAGSTVVNPLSTLVAQVMRDDTGLSASAANQRVTQALGLPDDVDLGRLDPLAANSTTALQMQKAAAKVATLVMGASSDSQEQASLFKTLAQNLSSAAEQNQTVSLDSGSFIANVLLAARLVDSQGAQQLSQELGAQLTAIAQATTLDGISSAQSAALDTTAPGAPIFKQALPGGAGLAPQLTFKLKVSADDGSAVSAGDVIRIDFDAGTTVTQTVTPSDMARGLISVAVLPDQVNQSFRATLTDVGQRSSEATVRSIDQGGDPDTFDLSQELSSMAMVLMQGASEVDLPGIGKLDVIVKPLAQAFMDALASLPNLKRVSSTPVAARAVPLAAAETMDFSDPSLDGYFAVDDGAYDAGYDNSDSGAAIIWDFSGDAEPEPFDPQPYIQPSGSDSPNQSPTPSPLPAGKKNLFQALEDEIRAWSREQLGIDFDLDLEFDGGYDAIERSGYVRLVGSLRDLQLPFSGDIGSENLNLALDTTIDLNAAVAFTFFVKSVTREVTVNGTQTEQDYWVIETDKSGLNVYAGGGLTPGDAVSGTLGPFVASFTDQNSARAPEDLARRNTALEVSAELKLRDNDTQPEDQELTLSGDTISTYFDDVFSGNLADWYALKAAMEGRISGHAQLMLDFSQLIDSDNATVEAVLDFLRLNFDVDITVPLSLSYDSTKTTTQDYGRIFLDNISTGIEPLVSEKLGPAVELMDTYLGWLFDFKDLMYAPTPGLGSLFTPFQPIPIPDWLAGGLPGKWSEAGSFESDIYNLINQPIVTINQGLAAVKDGMDFNNDDVISNLETIKGTATFLYLATNELTNVWDYVNSIPGLKATLSGTGYGAVAVAILDGVKASVPVFEGILQGVLVVEDVLATIDDLHQVSKSYHAAQYDDSVPGLQIDLGSHVFDFKTGSMHTLDRGLYTNVLDYLYPLPANPEPGLTYEQALERIWLVADANDATATNMHEHVFLTARIEGVTSQNVAALRDMLNSDAIDSSRLKLNRFNEAVRGVSDPISTTDSKQPHDGIQDEVDAYTRLIDFVTNRPFRGELIATPEEQFYFDKLGKTKDELAGTDEKRYASIMLDAFKTLGIVDPNFAPSASTKARYLNAGSTEIVYDILDMQNLPGIDTIAELQALWTIKNQLEDLSGNRWSSPVDKVTDTTDAQLTLQDLARLRAPLVDEGYLVRNLRVLNGAFIPNYGELPGQKADEFIEMLVDKINLLNKEAIGQSTNPLSGDFAFSKIKLAAANDVAKREGLTELDFSAAGLNGVSQAILPLLLGSLDLDRTHETGEADESNWNRNDYQLHIDGINTLYKAVNGQTVDYSELMNGIADIFDTPTADETWLKGMEDAFWYLGQSTNNTHKLDLLAKVLVDRTWTEVDTVSELSGVINVIRKIGWLTLSNDALYANLKLRDGFKEKTDADVKTIVSKMTSRAVNLTPEDMALIGYPGLGTADTEKLSEALKAQLLAARNTGDTDLPKLNPALTFSSFGDLVEKNIAAGWYADMLNDPNPNAFVTFLRDMKAVGFDFPVLRNGDIVGQIFNWFTEPDQPVEVSDLLTFTPKFPDLTLAPIEFSYDFLEGVVPWASLEASVTADLGVIPRITLGLDTLGLASFARAIATGDGDLSVFKTIPNSFYLADTHMNNGRMEDLPELEAWVKLTGMIELMLGSKTGLINAFAHVKGGAEFDFILDIEDPDGDGKARMWDLIEQGIDGGFAGMFDLDLAINAMLGVGAGINLDLTPADGLPADWDPVSKALVQAGVAVYEYFGGQTKFKAEVGHQWDFPIYNSATGESVFNV